MSAFSVQLLILVSSATSTYFCGVVWSLVLSMNLPDIV